MRAYIAGPLFNQGDRWFDEQIEAIAVRAGLKTFLPHRDNKEAQQDERSLNAIFKGDLRGLDEASIVIANLNGSAIDDGTAWEIGYAYARGKHLVGVHTDMRLMMPNQVVNLMIECSLHEMVHSLDDLTASLATWQAHGA